MINHPGEERPSLSIRAASVTDLNHHKSQLLRAKTQRPCVLRQKSAPSRYGSGRRYLTRQHRATSSSDVYHHNLGTPDSHSSDIWAVSPARPRQTLDLTAKQGYSHTTRPSTLFICIIFVVFVMVVVASIVFFYII